MLEETLCLTLWETSRKLESNHEFDSRYLVLQCADKHTRLSKRTAKEPQARLRYAKGCHEERGVCSCAKDKILITAEMRNMEDVSRYNLI